MDQSPVQMPSVPMLPGQQVIDHSQLKPQDNGDGHKQDIGDILQQIMNITDQSLDEAQARWVNFASSAPHETPISIALRQTFYLGDVVVEYERCKRSYLVLVVAGSMPSTATE